LSTQVVDPSSTELAEELRGPDGHLTMAATSDVIGSLRSVELALFAWLGQEAPSGSSAEEIVWASAASRRAAWRALQLETLMPVSLGLVPTSGWVANPRSQVAAWLATLAGDVPDGAGPEADHRVLEGALTCYGPLLDAYRFRLEHRSRAADGPLERVLDRLTSDLEAEQHAARRLTNTTW
jgi:hypothetical protein